MVSQVGRGVSHIRLPTYLLTVRSKCLGAFLYQVTIVTRFSFQSPVLVANLTCICTVQYCAAGLGRDLTVGRVWGSTVPEGVFVFVLYDGSKEREALEKFSKAGPAGWVKRRLFCLSAPCNRSIAMFVLCY